MNKNLIVFLITITLIIEYKTGYKKAIVLENSNYKITYPTTVIKRGHNRIYIDMRKVKRIYKVPMSLKLKNE